MISRKRENRKARIVRRQRGGGDTMDRSIPAAAVLSNPQGVPDELDREDVSET